MLQGGDCADVSGILGAGDLESEAADDAVDVGGDGESGGDADAESVVRVDGEGVVELEEPLGFLLLGEPEVAPGLDLPIGPVVAELALQVLAQRVEAVLSVDDTVTVGATGVVIVSPSMVNVASRTSPVTRSMRSEVSGGTSGTT